MSTLEIFLMLVLWIIIGLWISYKRNWYIEDKVLTNNAERKTAIITNIILMPVIIFITIFNEYLNSDWDKN